MKSFNKLTCWTITSMFFVSGVYAQNSTELPAQILKLVPPGTVLESQSFNATPSMTIASFIAFRKADEDRRVEYKLTINVYDNASPAWKMRESAYRSQMESRTSSSRRGLAPESANLGLFTADPVQETKKSWGSGLTQRLLNHYPNSKEFITYSCAYYGMVGGVVFELSASGIPDNPGEANKWAEDVASVASELSLSNIGK